MTATRPSFVAWRDGPTLLALLAALVARPLIYTLVDPQPFLGPLDGSQGRRPWWLFHLWILLWQWLPFCVAWWALVRSGRPWSTYGVDWGWFRRHRRPLLAGAALLAVCAFAAPRYWYGTSPPAVARTLALLPVTGWERLFFLVASVSAGICEETCYRGLPLRGAVESTAGALALLPVTILSFVFVHGWFGWEHLGAYAAVGLAFGAAFLLLRRRRLEWLMVAHALLDAALVAAP